LKIKLELKETEGSNFQRVGNDLVYVQKITLRDALLQQPIKIITLDGRKINLNID
jgi:DnaJ-class molecular chaperone